MDPSPLLALRVLWRQRQLERGCGMSSRELAAHQLQQIENVRQFAYKNSSFYARFHRGLERAPVDQLPPLSKGVMMENFDDLVTDRTLRLTEAEEFLRSTTRPSLFRGKYVALATSGSTGRRGVFLFNTREWITALANITRPIKWAGMQPNPLKPHRYAFIASTAPWHYSARVSHSLSSGLLPSLKIDAGTPIDLMVKQLNEWQPETIAAYPSVLRQLADEQVAGRLHISLRAVATSAETLTAETRRKAQQAWTTQVYDTYGASEYAPIAAECQYGNRHLVEDAAFIEVADEKGRVVPAGEDGERVLITVFHRFTQPLIRYEISDLVRRKAGTCGCGRPFQMIEAIEGRKEDILHFPGTAKRDVAIHPNVFDGVLERVPASAWQITQDGEVLIISLAGLREPDAEASIAGAISKRLQEEGAQLPRIEVLRVESLERGLSGKAPLIRCKRAWIAQPEVGT